MTHLHRGLRSLRRPILGVIVVWAIGVTGCPGVNPSGDGIGHYTMQDQYRQDVSSVFVSMFFRGRDVYRRELEYRLTEAIQKRIEMTTDYKITSRSRADSELSGEITLIEQRPFSFNPDSGDPRELEITMSIAFRWRNLETGEELARDERLQVTSTYIPDPPLGEDFFQGSQDAIEKAARRIVERMEAPWGEDEDEDEQAADVAQS